MADDADRANDQQQNLVDAAIKKAQSKSLDTTNLSGVCLTCGEVTGKFRRWCNKTCCEEWSNKN
jgi:hypothetical protein